MRIKNMDEDGDLSKGLVILKELLKECSHCREDVVISYECPKCRTRACLICAVEKRWKCPNCASKLI